MQVESMDNFPSTAEKECSKFWSHILKVER